MIPAEKEAFARRLLEGKKLSIKKIAELVGIARGTVELIIKKGRERAVAKPAHNVGSFSKQARRCPGCGASAYFPEDSLVCYECLITEEKGAKNVR